MEQYPVGGIQSKKKNVSGQIGPFYKILKSPEKLPLLKAPTHQPGLEIFLILKPSLSSSVCRCHSAGQQGDAASGYLAWHWMLKMCPS